MKGQYVVAIAAKQVLLAAPDEEGIDDSLGTF